MQNQMRKKRTWRHLSFVCILLACMAMVSCVVILPPNDLQNEAPIPEGAIPVHSNYPNLQYLIPGAFHSSERTSYDAPWNHVAVLDGQLSVYGEDYRDERGLNIVKAGVEHNCFRLRGDSTGVYQFNEAAQSWEMIIEEYCVGLYHANHWCLILTYSSQKAGHTSVRGFLYDDEADRSYLTEPLDFEGYAVLSAARWGNFDMDREKVVYAVSGRNFTELRFDPFVPDPESLGKQIRGITVVQHELPEWWVKAEKNRDLHFTNMVVMEDGAVYIGEKNGVIGMRNGVITYYPIRHREVMGSGE